MRFNLFKIHYKFFLAVLLYHMTISIPISNTITMLNITPHLRL